MKKLCLIGLIALAGFAPLAQADSNGTLGGIVNSETVNLGAGPFDHAGTIGNAGNTTLNPTFVGGFTANRVRFSGTLTSVLAGTFASEADIRITLGAFAFNWQNPGGSSTFTTLNYNSTQTIAGINPAGTWGVQFFESFDDGAGPDARSTNVTMEFQNVQPNTDSNGSWNLGNVSAFNPVTRVGEFAVGGVHDRYTFTTTNTLTFSIGTDFQNVLLNQNLDTEIGVFDATTGNIVPGAFDDDNGPGLYSQLSNLVLGPGIYTVVVAPFNTNFSNTSTLSNLTFGTSLGDYRLQINAVPEPTTLGALTGFGLMGLAFGLRRRRN